jgi:hypothetical protein
MYEISYLIRANTLNVIVELRAKVIHTHARYRVFGLARAALLVFKAPSAASDFEMATAALIPIAESKLAR